MSGLDQEGEERGPGPALLRDRQASALWHYLELKGLGQERAETRVSPGSNATPFTDVV